MEKGKFIVIEGMDGSGKTTILEMFKQYLNKNKLSDNFVFTREPGSAYSKEAEKIRNLILDNENSFSPMVDALLFATSRRLNLEHGIWPALKENKVVISDRYWYSSFVYQGILSENGLEKIQELNYIATDNSKPDFCIFLDLKPKKVVERLTKLRTSMDRLEHNEIAYYEKLRKAYHQLIKQNPNEFIVIDAECSISELFNRFFKALKDKGIVN